MTITIGEVIAVTPMDGDQRKPSWMTDDHIEFLNALHDRFALSAYAMRPLLETEFDLTTYKAGRIVSYWCRTRYMRGNDD